MSPAHSFYMNRRGTEPYARWCGRTAGAIPPPTRLFQTIFVSEKAPSTPIFPSNKRKIPAMGVNIVHFDPKCPKNPHSVNASIRMTT